MEALIIAIAKSLVDNPEEVEVNVLIGDNAAVFELKVAKVDLGKVIGKKGRTATAMRTILNAVSAKNNKRAILEILD